MSCVYQKTFSRRKMNAEDLVAWQEHAKLCAECGVRQQSFDVALGRLKAQPNRLSATQKVALWSGIEAKTQPSWSVVRLFVRVVPVVIALSVGLVSFAAIYIYSGADFTEVKAFLQRRMAQDSGHLSQNTRPAMNQTFETEPPSLGVDVDTNLYNQTPVQHENEVAVVGPVPTVLRPDFRPRKVSSSRASSPSAQMPTSSTQRRVSPAQQPAPKVAREVEALLAQADTERRSGAFSSAAQAYLRVLRHSDGERYAEEAEFRYAQMLTRLGQDKEALGVLEKAQTERGTGVLAPERLALQLSILLDRGEPGTAAAVFEKAPNRLRNYVVRQQALNIAEALLPGDKVRAQHLIVAILTDDCPSALRNRGEKLLAKIRAK